MCYFALSDLFRWRRITLRALYGYLYILIQGGCAMMRILSTIAALGLSLLASRAPAFGADVWDFSLIPDTGSVTGPAGSTVGWGYSLDNESATDWLVTADVDSGAFLDGTPILIFDFPILGPGTSVTVPYDPSIPAGLFALAWDETAPEGFTNTGDFTVSVEWWDGDPSNGGAYVADGLDISQPYSATVSSAVAGVPEPGSGAFIAAALLSLFLARLVRWRGLPAPSGSGPNDGRWLRRAFQR
jgi:hypothetical protein